jgi:dolichol-phosphate mannosyltransferase
VLRLYSVYGPWEEPNRLIPMLVMHGLEGRYPPLANPTTARDYVHVDDVCDAYRAAAEQPGIAPGTIYNVGSGIQTTLIEAAELAGRLFGIREAPRWGSMPDRIWDTTVWKADPAKIGRELGWKPTRDFARGIQDTVAWFRSCQPAVRDRYREALLRVKESR